MQALAIYEGARKAGPSKGFVLSDADAELLGRGDGAAADLFQSALVNYLRTMLHVRPR